LGQLISISVKGARDKIPNVRFVASITLEHIAKYADSTVVATQVRPCLAEMVNDTDGDVKYYSSVALETLAG
jgi:hypothetical protein